MPKFEAEIHDLQQKNSIHPSMTIAGGERAGCRPGRPPARRTPRTGTAAEARAQGWALGSWTLSASKKKPPGPTRVQNPIPAGNGKKMFPANPQMTKQQPVSGSFARPMVRATVVISTTLNCETHPSLKILDLKIT